MGAALACVGDEPSGMVTLDQGADELAGGERLGELWVDAPEGQSGQNRGSCHLHMEDAQFDPSGLTADAPIGWPDPAEAAVFVLELRGVSRTRGHMGELTLTRYALQADAASPAPGEPPTATLRV